MDCGGAGPGVVVGGVGVDEMDGVWASAEGVGVARGEGE